MKIFLSFLQSPKKYAIPAYDFWEYYIKNGIIEAGLEWEECPGVDWAEGLVPKTFQEQSEWRSAVWDKTVCWLKEHKADLFLSYLYPEQIDAGAIAEIKKMGIPCVNFFCDNVRLFREVPSEFAAFTLNWVPEFKALTLYRNAGYPYLHLPMPMWVNQSLRVVKPESNRQITFIGSRDIQRLMLLEEIINEKPDITLTIYGNNWAGADISSPAAVVNNKYSQKLYNQYQFIKQFGLKAYRRKLRQRKISQTPGKALLNKIAGPVDFEEYNLLTATSMITMGINRYPSFYYPLSQPDSYSRLRDLEAPMLGACYLTEYTAGLEELYDIGNEIISYKSTSDFIEKVNRLEHDEKKRQQLKLNGQRRALAMNSIPASLHKIFSVLHLPWPEKRITA